MGKAGPLNLLNTAAWLILTCSHPRPFCLRLGDHALALYVLAPCVYMQRQRQEASRQVIEGKDAESISKGIKRISMIDMASKEKRKQENKREGKQARKQKKGGVHEEQM